MFIGVFLSMLVTLRFALIYKRNVREKVSKQYTQVGSKLMQCITPITF